MFLTKLQKLRRSCVVQHSEPRERVNEPERDSFYFSRAHYRIDYFLFAELSMTQSKTAMLSAVVALALSGAAWAAVNDAGQSAGAAVHERGHHYGAGHRTHSPFMRAVHHLNLSDDQKQRIASLLSTERTAKGAHAGEQFANRAALANPGDPNYAAAVSAAKAAAANAVQERSNLEVQIYGLLTADQQAELPKVLAEMKTRREEHRARHREANGTV
jgi:Spy/CpxP family protein refolding chaperone